MKINKKGEAGSESLLDPFQEVRHGMELIDVIRGRIAGKSNHEQMVLLHDTQLLHTHRSLLHNRFSLQAELRKQPIGCFGSTGKSAWEDFRMGNHHPLMPSGSVTGE